jgi:hypothetical protein
MTPFLEGIVCEMSLYFHVCIGIIPAGYYSFKILLVINVGWGYS